MCNVNLCSVNVQCQCAMPMYNPPDGRPTGVEPEECPSLTAAIKAGRPVRRRPWHPPPWHLRLPLSPPASVAPVDEKRLVAVSSGDGAVPRDARRRAGGPEDGGTQPVTDAFTACFFTACFALPAFPPLTFHYLPLPSLDLPLHFHCLSLTFHCLHLAFHCIFTACL